LSKGKDKIKVLFAGRYNFSEVLSGTGKTTKRIFAAYAKSNTAVFTSYFFDGRKYGLLKKLFGKEVSVQSENASVYTLGLFRIFPVLFKTKPDIVHIITYERFAVCFIFLKIFFGYKIIYHNHGLISLENKIKELPYFYRTKDKICEKLFLKYSDKIIFPSDVIIEVALNFHKFNKNKIRIIPNGIDAIYHFPDNTRVYNNNKLNVILETEKIGFEDSVLFISDALELIKFPVRLNIIGKRKNIFKENDKLKIIYVDKMETHKFADFLMNIDVFISLIRYDTFSISAAEAMAAGVIPIINKNIGIAHYITNGVNGYKINYDDSASLAKYLDILNCDSGKRRTMSCEAKKIYDELSWDKVYKKYEKLYFAE